MSVALAAVVCIGSACSGGGAAAAKPQDARVAVSVPSASQLAAAAEALVRRDLLFGQAVRDKVERARDELDIIAATCLDDKRTEIDVNLRSAQAHLESLNASQDRERRAHEFTLLSVLDQRVRGLDAEASQCGGQGLYDTGETRSVSKLDAAALPPDDNARAPRALSSVQTTPPPPVSVSR